MVEEISADNCTAYELVDELGLGMDFMVNPMETKWKCYLTSTAYRKLKNDPEGYLYASGGIEWVRVWENTTIPFIIHMRLAGIEDDMVEKDPESLGCRAAIDDGK